MLFVIIIAYVSLLCVYCACVFICVGVYNCMMYVNNSFHLSLRVRDNSTGWVWAWVEVMVMVLE